MRHLFTSFLEHARAVRRGFSGIFGAHYNQVPFERIVFVCGINTVGKRMRPFIIFLRKHFPRVEIVAIQEYYIHHQREKVEHMISRTVEELRNEKKTLVIGHSFGGIVARAAIGRLREVDHILLLSTLASPHGISDFGVAESIDAHGVPEMCSVPVLTFGGRADAVVPDEYTHLKGEVGHITISCTHIAFLRTSRTHKEVLAAIMQYFSLRA